MKPALHPEWKRIAKKAYSMRLLYLAGILTACEAVLPLFTNAIPQGTFVALNMLIIPAAMVARITSQKGFD